MNEGMTSTIDVDDERIGDEDCQERIPATVEPMKLSMRMSSPEAKLGEESGGSAGRWFEVEVLLASCDLGGLVLWRGVGLFRADSYVCCPVVFGVVKELVELWSRRRMDDESRCGLVDPRSSRDGKGRRGCGGGGGGVGGGRGRGVGAVRISSEGGGSGEICVGLGELEKGKGELERKDWGTTWLAAVWLAAERRQGEDKERRRRRNSCAGEGEGSSVLVGGDMAVSPALDLGRSKG
ncbi:hypothetical protein Droror1_Dr00016102 [Drosera rotundifolia]